MKLKKTTEKHLAVFRLEIEKWIEIFGMVEWELHFKRVDLINARASLQPNVETRIAIFNLCKEWTDRTAPLNSAQLRYLGMHEVAELLLADLSWMATCRYVQPEEIETARHTVIGRFVKYMNRN